MKVLCDNYYDQANKQQDPTKINGSRFVVVVDLEEHNIKKFYKDILYKN